MRTIHDAGTPRDVDLPTLDVHQLDALTKQLTEIDSDSAEPFVAAQIWPLQAFPARRRRRGAPSIIAATVAVTAAAVSLYGVARDHPADGPSTAGQQHIVEAPAPNFPCVGVGATESQLTQWAAYLPWGRTGDQQATIGMTDDALCLDFPLNGGGVGMSRQSTTFTAPIIYFGSSGPDNRSAYPIEMAFGVVENTVTDVEFVPTDPAGRATGTSTFVSLGDFLAFALPYDTAGTVQMYSGGSIVATQPAIITPTASHRAEFTPTGLPCDPAAAYALANASRVTIDFPTGAKESEVYLDSVEPDQPITEPRPLCLLIATADPAITGTATPLDVTDGIGFLTTTTVPGGQLLWGSLTGTADTIRLTDTVGARRQPPASNFDHTKSGWTPFVIFMADGELGVVSAQAVDDTGALIGAAVKVT